MLLGSLVLGACSSGSAAGGASSSGSGGPSGSTSSGAGGADPYAGVWYARYAGTYTVATPPQPKKSNVAEAIFTVTAGDGGNDTLAIAFSGAWTGSCSIPVTVPLGAPGTDATLPTAKCSFTDPKTGAMQTNTAGGKAGLAVDTLFVDWAGAFSGTVAQTPYSGTFDGVWIARRTPATAAASSSGSGGGCGHKAAFCMAGSEGCSGSCLMGSCACSPQPMPCALPVDCCSGNCTGGVCSSKK